MLTDIIACPGGDFCSLANAKSIPIALAIQERFNDLDYVYDLGDVSLNISGCINACGHHHVGNIGILGVDKDGSEWYQVTLGGEQGTGATGAHLGRVIGPSFSAEEMPDVMSQGDRYVRGKPHRRRALHRNVQPHRHHPVQGTRVRLASTGSRVTATKDTEQMASIIKNRAIVNDDWTVVRAAEDGTLPAVDALPAGKVHCAARAVAGWAGSS